MKKACKTNKIFATIHIIFILYIYDIFLSFSLIHFTFVYFFPLLFFSFFLHFITLVIFSFNKT